MYTFSKYKKVSSVEKTLTRRGDNFATVTIEVTNYDGKFYRAHVFAFTSPFGEKSRSHSQFFEGDHGLCEAWALFKGFQTILGGDFDD